MAKRLTGIRRLAKNRWEVRVVKTNRRTGKRMEVKKRIEGDEDAAIKARLDLKEELEELAPRSRPRLVDYATLWLRTRLAGLKPSTAEKYAAALDLHILPALGDFYIDSLRPSDVAEWVGEQSKQYSGWTVVNRFRTLRTLARDALAEGLTSIDFCARVRLPETAAYDEDDPNLLSSDQLDKLLQAVPWQWYPIVLLMATTGLRWGEASGLRWEDIEGDRIRVRRTNWKGTPQTPKTRKSRRTVALLPEVRRALFFQRSRQSLSCPWVFPTLEGTLHKGTPLRNVLAQACTAAEVPRITAHGLRRTFNDLGRRVASREVLKAITGHSTDRMVEHYSVVGIEEKRAAAEGILRLARSPKVEFPVETRGIGSLPNKEKHEQLSGGATRI